MTSIRLAIADKKRALIAVYKSRQDAFKMQIQQMIVGCEQTHQKIMKEKQLIKETTSTVKRKIKQFVDNCLSGVTDGRKGKDIIDIKELGNYLNIEKQLLKGLASKEDAKDSNPLDLHKILSKAKLEHSLRKLKKLQLEEEIKFLESNVIVKGTLIYNAATSNTPSPAEEKEINARLVNLIQELERVITLGLPCISNKNNEQQLQILNEQELRLKQCEEILSLQQNKMSKFDKYFQQEFSVLIDNLPMASYLERDSIIQTQGPDNEYEQISQLEVDQILSYNPSIDLPANKFQHCFEDISEKIGQLCKKYKKIELMM